MGDELVVQIRADADVLLARQKARELAKSLARPAVAAPTVAGATRFRR